MNKVKKILSVVLLLFLFQFVTSCFWGCNCPELEYYEIEYISVTLKALDTSGVSEKPVTDSVPRNSFGLEIHPEYEAKKISQNLPSGQFGFSGAYACDCVGPQYEFLDPVEFITITMVDLDLEMETLATGLFGYYTYNGEIAPIEGVSFANSNYFQSFTLELADFESVPNNVVFKVDLTLKSGMHLIKQTEPIHFY